MNPFRLPRTTMPFKKRSEQRDREFDHQLIAAVADAIDVAIRKTEEQRDGLDRRINDVISCAAIVTGNGSDDYLTRDEVQSNMLSASDSEINGGQARLKTLAENLSHFKFLKAALHSRFGNHW